MSTSSSDRGRTEPPSASEAPSVDANQILDRLKDATDTKTDAALARMLGVSKSTVTNWRKRNTVRLERLVPIAKRYGVPMEYLTTGVLALTEGILVRLDIETLAAVFKFLAHHGYIALPMGTRRGDPAMRAAMEFRTQETRAASLLTELLHRRIPREDAMRMVLRQLAPEADRGEFPDDGAQ